MGRMCESTAARIISLCFDCSERKQREVLKEKRDLSHHNPCCLHSSQLSMWLDATQIHTNPSRIRITMDNHTLCE